MDSVWIVYGCGTPKKCLKKDINPLFHMSESEMANQNLPTTISKQTQKKIFKKLCAFAPLQQKIAPFITPKDFLLIPISKFLLCSFKFSIKK